MPWNILSPSPSSPRKNETMAKASLGLGLLELVMVEWELQCCLVVAVGSKGIRAGLLAHDWHFILGTALFWRYIFCGRA